MASMSSIRVVVVVAGAALLSAAVSARVAGQAPAAPATGGAATVIVPAEAWSCGLPGGIPHPESGLLVFEARVPLGRVADIGQTPFGRRQVAITGEGTLTGSRVTGSVMTGALDYQLILANGVIEIEQIFVFRTSDGRYIYARGAGTGADASDVRIVMDFEAPNDSAVAWLNTGTYVARRVVDAGAKAMTVRVYDVSKVPPAAGERVVRITKPAGVPPQPWEYRHAAAGEKRGAELITESVTLAPSQSVGASKRGVRNIIPITGGELKGRLTGKVVPGGADYQNLSKPATIDARYLWETSEGEVIIVRNGGAFGSLVPTFEVRVDSKYAWLNSGTYLSSNPGMAAGGVALTFYESTR